MLCCLAFSQTAQSACAGETTIGLGAGLVEQPLSAEPELTLGQERVQHHY